MVPDNQCVATTYHRSVARIRRPLRKAKEWDSNQFAPPTLDICTHKADAGRTQESGYGLRAIGRSQGGTANMVRRGCLRGGMAPASYKAQTAQKHGQQCRTKLRVPRKLDDTALRETVQAFLRAPWSPEWIAGMLTRSFPDEVSY